MITRIGLCAATLLLSACGMAKYEDVSSTAAYRTLVGKQLRSNSTLYIYGVTLDRNHAPVIGQYSITSPPGFDGPEVLSRGKLPAGTLFKAIGVRRCTNCPDERIEIVVQLSQYSGAPVEMPYSLYESGAVTVAQ